MFVICIVLTNYIIYSHYREIGTVPIVEKDGGVLSKDMNREDS